MTLTEERLTSIEDGQRAALAEWPDFLADYYTKTTQIQQGVSVASVSPVLTDFQYGYMRFYEQHLRDNGIRYYIQTSAGVRPDGRSTYFLYLVILPMDTNS